MKRPKDLPDYSTPPLDELVLGFQFEPAQKYSSVFASKVWDLFKDEYPLIEEHPALEPTFETFGGVNPSPGVHLRFGTPPSTTRLWFVSKDSSHLIQFQKDRLLINWRKGQGEHDYPRFETICSRFENGISMIDAFFREHFSCEIKLNQAEVSYINIIPIENYSDAVNWISLIDRIPFDTQNLVAKIEEVIKDNDGDSYARLHHDLNSVVTLDGKVKALRLSLTFRGVPSGSDIKSGLEFLAIARSRIVKRFTEITSEEAHKAWERRI